LAAENNATATIVHAAVRKQGIHAATCYFYAKNVNWSVV